MGKVLCVFYHLCHWSMAFRLAFLEGEIGIRMQIIGLKKGRVKKISLRWDSEYSLQKDVVKWWKIACLGFRHNGTRLTESHLIHIPNEGSRSVAYNACLKAEGLRPGTPDLFLAVPSAPFGGLWIELKATNGQVRSNQLSMLTMLSETGFACAVCRSLDEVRSVITSYLEGNLGTQEESAV